MFWWRGIDLLDVDGKWEMGNDRGNVQCTAIVIVVISFHLRHMSPGTFRLHGVATRLYGATPLI